MKKLLSLLLTIMLIISAVPLNVFAIDGNSIESISFEDTFIYDGTQENATEPRFFKTAFVITFENGNTYEGFGGEDGVWVNNEYIGYITYSYFQDVNLWETGDVYEATASIAGVSGTYNVEVRENPIQEISIDDFCIIKSDEYFSEENGEVYNIYNLMGYYRPYYVTYKDGSSAPVYGPFSTGEYTSVDLLTTCVVPYEDWEGGNTYEVTGTLLGNSDTFNVTLLEIESIAVDDVECIQNFDGNRYGYWDENDNYVENTWFNYNIYPDNITVTFTNSLSISGNPSEISEYTGFYPNCYSDQSYENQWGLGNHTATINVCGYEQDYIVKVVETPIESILVDDITYIEGTNGWIDNDTENPGWFCYYINPEELTVILKNGDEISGTLNEVCEQLGCWQNCTSDQSYSNQWSVGEHKATIDLLGVTAEYKIIITESPVQSLEISDISIREKSTGWEKDGVFYYYNFYPDYTITMKDGSVVNNNGIEIDGEWYSLSIDKSIQYNEPWTVGNTYEVTGSILGVRDTFNVTITENPIESIVIDDIDVIVNTNGYYDSEYNCYIYSPNPTSFTAILKDGSHIQSVNGIVEIAGEHFGISSCDTNYWSQVENPWTVGNTYQMSASVGGFSDTFNVTITESPVVSIEVEDVTCIEGTRGQYVVDDGGYYFYNNIYFRLNYKVTLSDGSVLEAEEPYIEWGGGGDYGVYINGEFYTISNVVDNQDVSHWSVGTHTATAEFMGVTDEFDVTIIESPVESVEIEDITLINGIDFHKNDSYINCYSYPTYTLTFKDGTQKTLKNGSGISLDSEYISYLDVNYNELLVPFEIGESYEIIGSFGCVTDAFIVNVIENPVASIDVIKAPDKTDYLIGEYCDLKGMVIRVQYNDDTYEDIEIKNHCNAYSNASYYSKKLQRFVDVDISWNNAVFTKAGDQVIEFDMFNKNCKLDVNVVENPIESITINEEGVDSVIITLNNTDGTAIDMTLLSINFVGGVEIAKGMNVLNVQLFTDIGTFQAKIYNEKGGFSIGLGDDSNNIIWSNAIKSEWYDVVQLISQIELPLSMLQKEVGNFNGKITSKNVDSIIKAAGYINYFWYSDKRIDKTQNHFIYSGESIRQEVLKYFALDYVDLSLSENYDPITDTYRFWKDESASNGFNIPYEIMYMDGVWTVKLTTFAEELNEEDVIYLKLDKEHKITQFTLNTPNCAGDINDDSKINNKDLGLLMQYLNDWEVQISLDAADVNDDGNVNNKDYGLLMQYLNGWDVVLK